MPRHYPLQTQSKFLKNRADAAFAYSPGLHTELAAAAETSNSQPRCAPPEPQRLPIRCGTLTNRLSKPRATSTASYTTAQGPNPCPKSKGAAVPPCIKHAGPNRHTTALSVREPPSPPPSPASSMFLILFSRGACTSILGISGILRPPSSEDMVV